MLDFKYLLELIIAKDKNNQLPIVGPKDHTSLHEAITSLVGLGSFYPSAFSKKMIYKELLDEFSDAQYDSISYGDSFETLDGIVESLTGKLKTTTDTINNIKDQVTILSKDINDRVESYISRDPFASLHYGKTSSDVEYDKIEWAIYKSLGTDINIKTQVHQLLNVSVDTNVTHNLFSLAISKLVNKSTDYQDIDLPKNVNDEIIEQLNNYLDDVLLDDIKDVVNMVTKSTRTNRLRNNIITHSKQLTTVKTILFYLSTIDKMYKVISAIQSGTLDLSKSARNRVAKNCETLQKYMLIMAYGIMFNRTEFFSNALILPEKYINPDNLDEFVAQDGDNQMIAHHLFYLHKDGIPSKGISGSSIISMSKNIKNMVLKETRNVDTRLKLIKHDATREAFKYVVSEYIKKEQEDGQELINKNSNELIKSMCETIIVQDRVVEDAVYEVIVGLFYKNTFVETIYKRLGKEYLELLTNKSDINDEDILFSEVSVFVDLLCDFMCNFVEKK